ncbi:(2,3-dihydroxybenzoyl)adenylate synthase [Chitinimonas sp. BJB300]|nr:(2,3-dihydroxybenzoyl)adenylate synthase [Chitinimonas sp. BJB300]TSJ87851.1 (2,3-dihydroxybenzoyl)adenylate synthase [Chitinimonas sp. BJB300]
MKQDVLPGCVAWPEEVAARYRALGYWRGLTLGDLLSDSAQQWPDRIALVCGERRWCYADLDQRVDKVAAGLRSIGIRAQDRVVVQLPNVAEFFVAIFALFRIGALPVFALPAHRRAEISHFCTHTDAVAYLIADADGGFDYRQLACEVLPLAPSLRHVIVVGEAAEFVAFDSLYREVSGMEDPVGPSAADIAFLQLSGGSTGLPKLIPRTHDDYFYSVRASAEICGLTPESIYLCALPVAHNFPLSSPGSMGVFYAGGCVVLSRSPAPDAAFPLIAREGVTHTALVPPLAMIWLDAAKQNRPALASLQWLQVGGAKFSEEAARRVEPELGCQLQQVFGMAEGLVNYTRADDPIELVLTTQGCPISVDDEVRVVDDEDHDLPDGEVGHLLTRGPYTIRGYYRAEQHNERAFTPDGFYRTGDLVRRLPSGHLVVEGRAKDQINRGGEKVAAEEVENHLLAHPQVHDAALVSMPDAYLGEKSCAFIIARPGAALRMVELAGFLRLRGLAQYKIPDRFEFVDQFPKTGVGKVDKRTLRERIACALAESAE